MRVLFLPDYTQANAYQRLLADALRGRGVTVTADPTGRRRLLGVLGAVRRQGRPNIVHIHWTEPYISGGRTDVSRLRVMRTLTELRLLRRAGIGIVWTAHDLSRHDRPMERLELDFNRELFRLSRAVIVHCEAARGALLDALSLPPSDSGKTAVIPHGHYIGAYPDSISSSEARQRLGLTSDGRVVAFVGWVRPYKGVIELIESFRAVADPAARLVIAGTPLPNDFADELRNLASGDPRVVLRFGFVPDDEIQVYLRAADVVALPYREIFTSGSVLLAMSFGRPVIVPRMGCIAEAVDATSSIMYDAGEPAALATALQTAMAADLTAMGERARTRAATFDWTRIADRTLELYRRRAQIR
jgi:glycosyltransferase involved in cell wall biosynthesis